MDVTSSSGVPYLSTRLARLALEVDRVAQQINAADMTDAEGLVLAAPVHHLALAVDSLQDTLHRAESVAFDNAEQAAA